MVFVAITFTAVRRGCFGDFCPSEQMCFTFQTSERKSKKNFSIWEMTQLEIQLEPDGQKATMLPMMEHEHFHYQYGVVHVFVYPIFILLC